ncbi:MAG: hypothetical protein B6D41_09165 [Chloroflexi bacterium UTCFX4]|nr:MAG: hypothetical protein B6D41_09165 [Chloroflexi bacterium UTCFX4]
MNQSTVVAPRESVATIPAKWQPWARVLWIFIALNCAVAFGMTMYFTWQFTQNLPPRLTEGLSALGWSSASYFSYSAFLLIFHFFCFYFMGLLIFWLRPMERMAFFASIFFIAFAAANAYISAPEYLQIFKTGPMLYQIAFNVSNLFAWPLLIAFCAVFPTGHFVPRWTRYLALFGFTVTLAWSSFPQQFANPQGAMVVTLLGALLIVFGGSFLAQILRYRNYSTAAQQQQTKWLLYGLALIVLGAVLVPTLSFLILPASGFTDARTTVLSDLIANLLTAIYAILPLSVGVAILRYRLWDIDIIIRKTVTYTIVVALLGVLFFGSVILLQQIFANVTGQRSEWITIISTLAIAALFVPLRKRIQDVIDKRFYRKKYDAQQVLQKFAETVRDETDLDKLTAELVNVVQETMQPKSVSVWLKADDGRQTTGNRQHATDDGG